MLPIPSDVPALIAKFLVRFAVAFFVSRELGSPVVSIQLRKRGVLRAPVPEASIDEDSQARSREDDVSPATLVATRREVDSVPESSGKKGTADYHLGACITAPIRPHRAGDPGVAGPRNGCHLANLEQPESVDPLKVDRLQDAMASFALDTIAS